MSVSLCQLLSAHVCRLCPLPEAESSSSTAASIGSETRMCKAHTGMSFKNCLIDIVKRRHMAIPIQQSKEQYWTMTILALSRSHFEGKSPKFFPRTNTVFDQNLAIETKSLVLSDKYFLSWHKVNALSLMVKVQIP